MILNIIPLICSQVDKNTEGKVDVLGVCDIIKINKSEPLSFTIVLFTVGPVEYEMMAHILLEDSNGSGGSFVGSYDLTKNIDKSAFQKGKVLLNSKIFIKVDGNLPDNVESLNLKVYTSSKKIVDETEGINQQEKFKVLINAEKLTLHSSIPVKVERL